jgi:pimeloyl-ACP methyl ester carboxylesterase
MHVAQAGPADAPPVLCLHGWPQHWWIWRHVIAELRGEFRLVCPDLRAFGWSSWPADGDFRKQRLADDALALLDSLGIERAHVLGHDWGAWTALLMGVGAPDRVRSLLALSIVHPWQPTGRALANAWRFAYQIPIAAPAGGELLQRQDTFVRRVLRSGWANREAWDEDAATLYAEALAQPHSAKAGSRLYRSFLLRELAPAVGGAFRGRRLTMPARLVIGRDDPLGPALAEGFERHGDDAAWEVLEGCGHFMPEERPEAVVDRARALFGVT